MISIIRIFEFHRKFSTSQKLYCIFQTFFSLSNISIDFTKCNSKLMISFEILIFKFSLIVGKIMDRILKRPVEN